MAVVKSVFCMVAALLPLWASTNALHLGGSGLLAGHSAAFSHSLETVGIDQEVSANNEAYTMQL